MEVTPTVHSPWVRLARWAIIGLAVFVLIISVIGLMRFPDYTSRHLAEFRPHDSWTAEQAQAAAVELGWSPLSQAWLALARDVLGMLVSYTFAAIMLSRKGRDWFGLYVALVFILLAPTSGNLFKPVSETLLAIRIYESVVGAAAWQLFFILLFFFPNGHAVPRWTRWLAGAWLASLPLSAAISDEGPIWPGFSTLAFVLVIVAILSQIYRYARRADAIQRQQTKWLVYVLGFALLVIGMLIPVGFVPPPEDQLGRKLLVDYALLLLFSLAFWLVPLAITIAILRYRLWDIDLIIRRTLVYGFLTLVLGLFYFGSVVILQQVLGGAIGQGSPVVIVLSTLGIAALFTPLRTRIQSIIDRRFYRNKYDGEQALLHFSQRLRDEVDLASIEAELLGVVQETIQPAQASIWMREGVK